MSGVKKALLWIGLVGWAFSAGIALSILLDMHAVIHSVRDHAEAPTPLASTEGVRA